MQDASDLAEKNNRGQWKRLILKDCLRIKSVGMVIALNSCKA
ncbi:hypothetical protein [Marinisporobacter balticus]|nr:hypothetical protein [Marinisporobacter balticus]